MENILKIEQEKQIENANLNLSAVINSHGALALPPNWNLHDAERYMAAPTRQRANVKSSTIIAALEYWALNNKPETAIFLDAEALKVQFVYNFGNSHYPGHKDNKSSYEKKWSKEYEFFSNFTQNGRMSQKKFVEILEDFAYCTKITGKDGKEISNAHAIQAARVLTVRAGVEATTTVGNFEANKSAMEAVSADMGDHTPAFIDLTVPKIDEPYAQEFKARFAVSVLFGAEKEVSISLREVAEFESDRQIANALKAAIKERVGDASPIYDAVIA